MNACKASFTIQEGEYVLRRYVVFFSLLVVGILLFGCQAVPRGQIPPPTFKLGEDIMIEGVDVSRMQVREAEETLKRHMQEKIDRMMYEVTLQDVPDAGTVKIAATEMPIYTNVEEMVREAAYLPQHNGLRKQPRALDVSLSLDTEAAQERIKDICSSFYVAPVDATATFDLEQEEYFIFTSEHSGRETDTAELTQLLAQAVETEESAMLSLSHTVLDPKYTEAQARAEHRLISTFSTSYAKSPLNASGRVFNITKAAGLINGYLLKPGEEFNTNGILGPRNKETGWKTAPGIREGRYEQEYGGGVCQVSTTLFNAVLLADLTVTDRQPHSWPSGYVDIGRDATISTGGPNFKFVNNTGHDLYIIAETSSKKKLTISLYGKPLYDDRVIKITSERVATLPSPGQEILLDESLPANTREVYREARRGKKSKTYKEYYDLDGNLIERKLAYEDTYRSIKGIVYISADLYYGVPEEPEATQISIPE